MTRQPDCILTVGDNPSPKNEGVSADVLADFSQDLKLGLQRLKNCTPHHEERGTAAVESAWANDTSSIDRDRLAELLINMGDDTAAFRLRYCGESGMGWIGKCELHPEHSTLYSPFWCEQRVCPACAKRRSWKLALQILEPIRRLAENAPDGYRLSHVTLTTDISLDEDISSVRTSAKRLRVGVRTLFQAMFPDDKNMGGIIGEEFGENGRKLHYHVLMLSKFIPKKKLISMWRKWTGGHGYIVHIRSVDDVYSAVAEVVKYCTKPMKTSGETQDIETTLARIHAVIKGRRRIQAFGIFYNMARDIDDEYECTCPDCGGPVVWRSELSEISAGVEVRRAPASVDLIESNKLLAQTRSPPSLDLPEQLDLFEKPQSAAYQGMVS